MLGHRASGSDGRLPEKRLGGLDCERCRARDSGKASRALPKRGQFELEARTNAEFAAFSYGSAVLCSPALPSGSDDVFRDWDKYAADGQANYARTNCVDQPFGYARRHWESMGS